MAADVPLERPKESMDPLSPPPPEHPRYDRELGTWVLSRYADVIAALREPRLRPRNTERSDSLEAPDETEQLRVRKEASEAFSASRVSEWEARIHPLAQSLAGRLATQSQVDLVSEFAQPWSLEVAAIVTEISASHRERLADLAREVSAATADPRNTALQTAAAPASAELEKSFQGGIPMAGPAFVALSQTLPSLLANAWLALLRHPSEFARLRDEPGLLPKAIEELLRYAGLARKVSRLAVADLELGAIRITKGERVILMLASANRDPAQFSDPDRVDFTRQFFGHLALGAGLHSCVGGLLIRMAARVATAAFVHNFGSAEMCAPVEWRGGSGFRSAASLLVTLRHNSRA